MSLSLNERRELLSRAVLYGILDFGYLNHRDPVTVARGLIEGGIDLLQLRAKGQAAQTLTELAKELSILCRQSGVLFIVNDWPELAAMSDADGVHVGQDDLSVDQARLMEGEDRLVGKSTHALDQAIAAEQEGADYIGIGPLFATPTKPDYVPVGLPLIQQVQSVIKIPGFCIGGIKLENLSQVIEAGAKRVVIVSGLLQAPDPVTYGKAVKACFGR